MKENIKIHLHLNEIFLSLAVAYFFLIIPCNLPTFLPMFIDSGTYSYVAQEINRGHMLYREIFEIKLPGTYYIYSLLFRLFSDTRWTLYFTDIATNILLLFFLYTILKNYNLQKYFGITCILFVTLYRVYPSFCGGNLNEHYFLFFYFLSCAILTGKSKGWKDFIAGISIALLMFFKQPFFIIPVFLIIHFRKRIFSYNFKYFISGFILVFFFFSYIVIRSFPESIDALFFYPLIIPKYVEKPSFFTKIKSSLIYTPFTAVLIITILSVIKRDFLRNYLLLSFILTSLLVFSPPLFYYYYPLLLLILLFPSLIILFKNYPYKIVIILFLLMALFPMKFIKVRIKHSIKALKILLVEKDTRVVTSPVTFELLRHLKKGDKYIMLPEYPQIYFITKTQSPFRFFYFSYAIPYYYKEELRTLIKEKPPNYIYLEKDIKFFERVFSLKAGEYILEKVDRNLYKFILK